MTPRHEQQTPGPALNIAATIAAHVPVLTTQRLTLRAPRLEDFDDFASIVCTERGVFVGGPMSREDGWYDFTGAVSIWMLHGHGMWTVVESASQRRLGFVALGLEPGDLERAEYERGVSCHHCLEERSDADRARYRERQKQIDLGRARGASHLG